jgi:phosphatidylglycerol:prolipoprotein diacylglycerol transferase
VYPNLFTIPQWVPLLGGTPITSFGVLMFAAFLVAAEVHRAEMRRAGEDPEKSWDLLFSAVIGGILGAKGYYLLLNWDRTLADPVGMVLSRGGLVWYGGFLLAALLVTLKIRRLGLDVRRQADMVAPALAISYAVGRIGCFLVGDDYGRPTGGRLGVRFPEGSPPSTVENLERQFGVSVDPALVERFGDVIPVHPTQLYEVAMSTLIFLVLWSLRKRPRRAGWLFGLWLVLAGLERLVVEVFRAKDDRFFGVFTLAQVISVGLVITGVVITLRLSKPGEPDAAPAGA